MICVAMICVVSKNDKRDLLSQISLYQYSTIPTAIYCDLLRSYSLECLTMQFVCLSYRIVSRCCDVLPFHSVDVLV